MKKIDLNFTLKNLDGKDLEPANDNNLVNAGKIIANNLVSTPKGDPLKHYDWAIKLNIGKALELDRADADYLKDFIKTHPGISILVKAQVLERFVEVPSRTK